MGENLNRVVTAVNDTWHNRFHSASIKDRCGLKSVSMYLASLREKGFLEYDPDGFPFEPWRLIRLIPAGLKVFEGFNLKKRPLPSNSDNGGDAHTNRTIPDLSAIAEQFSALAWVISDYIPKLESDKLVAEQHANDLYGHLNRFAGTLSQAKIIQDRVVLSREER